MEKMDDETDSPISILISPDGQVSIQGPLDDYDQPETFTLHLPFEDLDETNVTEISNDAVIHNSPKKPESPACETETLVNIDVRSEVLEGYMDIMVTYKCKACSYTSTDQIEFHKHCLEHLLKENLENKSVSNNSSTTVVYICSACNKPFNSSEETKTHMIQDHQLMMENEDVTSDIEDVRTINLSIESEQEVKKKKRSTNEIAQKVETLNNINLNFFCSKRFCHNKFSSESNLKIHENCHLTFDIETDSSRKLFQCCACHILHNNWDSCSIHLYKTHRIDCDLLKCPICETYRTTMPLRLENHMRIHSDVKAFSCKQCGKTFKQASQLRNHSVVHTEKDSPAKPNWSTTKQCNICFKLYSDSKSLKKHREEVHSKLRPFICNVCGHASARLSMLKIHQRQHTGQKPYACHICPYRTADHNSLRKHIMRHTGVRPYKCAYCNYDAIQSGSFKNHLKVAHPNLTDGMFVCGFCHYKTISEDNHVRHISDHLTGAIKETESVEATSASEGASTSSQEARLTDTFDSSLFRGGLRLELEEEAGTDGDRGTLAHEEDVVDTGGITIPAEPHSAIFELES